MKRDPRLRRLSSDHHLALVLAQRTAKAAESPSRTERVRAWRAVLNTFARNLSPHFAVEEDVLLPALEAAGAHALAERTREEHEALRRLVRARTRAEPERLRAFAALLTNHVRFEERELFETAQERLLDEALAAVAAAAEGVRRR